MKSWKKSGKKSDVHKNHPKGGQIKSTHNEWNREIGKNYRDTIARAMSYL